MNEMEEGYPDNFDYFKKVHEAITLLIPKMTENGINAHEALFRGVNLHHLIRYTGLSRLEHLKQGKLDSGINTIFAHTLEEVDSIRNERLVQVTNIFQYAINDKSEGKRALLCCPYLQR